MRLHTALIVDDEEERRHDMRDGLREHGVACDEAATVEEAIRRLVSAPYDLVVCDMILCDPPGAANPELRGYLAVCFALSKPGALVVQASSLRRWAHAGAVLTNWRADEVAELVYGCAGIPPSRSADGGCPLEALRQVTAATLARRRDAVANLLAVPIVRHLEPVLDGALAVLEDAAEGRADWQLAVSGAWGALFPGGRDAAV